MRGGRAGFTLLELLVTLSIVGVLVTIMVSNIDARRFQLDAAAKEVRASITTARGRALLQQHDMVLTFDVDGDRLYVLDDADNSGATNGAEERRMAQLPDGVKFDRGGAAAIQGESGALSLTKVSESLPALTFHRNGAASEEAILYITSVRAAGGDGFPQDTRALMVERATGRVRCLSYRTGAWVEGC